VPALHGVPEIGFVIQAGGFTVYFGGDTMLIPELSRLADEFPPIDIALLPINGLRVFGRQVVMDPLQAADLCALLKPRVAIPTHYAFTGGTLVDGLILKYFAAQQRLTAMFAEAVVKTGADTKVVVLEPGARFDARR
jgi:L-ascorbate metabolism protein UlaG (beta-lactamase superfamily)